MGEGPHRAAPGDGGGGGPAPVLAIADALIPEEEEDGGAPGGDEAEDPDTADEGEADDGDEIADAIAAAVADLIEEPEEPAPEVEDAPGPIAPKDDGGCVGGASSSDLPPGPGAPEPPAELPPPPAVDADEVPPPLPPPVDVPPPPVAAADVPRGRPLTMTMYGGTITWYPPTRTQGARYQANCPNAKHGDCNMTKSAHGFRGRMRPDREPQGRPLGLIAAWMGATDLWTTKDDHKAYEGVITRASREAARARLQVEPDGPEMLRTERKQRPGEPEEPEGAP